MLRRCFLATGVLLALGCAPHAQEAPAAPAPIISEAARVHPVLAPNGMVASQEARATRIGVDVAIDYRETAPAAATREMFLDAEGEADPEKSRNSALAVGVPGTVAGLSLAHARYGSGRLTLADLIAPAVALARDGIAVDDDLADSLPRAAERLARWPSSARIFLKDDGAPLARGDRLVQADLAATLEQLASEGPRSFYEGKTAARMADAVQGAGGILTREDLAGYRAVERAPVRGRYRGYEVLSMPPPSSGGVHLVQMLNILEGFALAETGAGSAATLHLMIEAMKRAYADRALHLGDPDFVAVPAAALTSRRYAETLRAKIDRERATPSADIRAGDPLPHEDENTTHYSVVDRDGNAVSNTYTLNFSYGLGMVAEGTGILLNNELDDFAAKPGAPNAYGLVGAEANAPGPGKRPLSSMTPTILMREGHVALVTGSPGGSRIITTVLQVILNVVDHGMNVAEAVLSPRIHHQWLPDMVTAERGLSPDTLRLLEARGHAVRLGQSTGSAHSILRLPQGWAGAADTRQRGTLAAGH